MWKLLLPILIGLGIISPYLVDAPTQTVVQIDVPTTYEVSITNRTSGEGRLSVLFIPQESGAQVEEPEGLDCFVDPRHQSYLACEIYIAAGDMGKVVFPVTWRQSGVRTFRIVVFAGTRGGPVTDAIFAEDRIVTVE